jgi:hypothetical protein
MRLFRQREVGVWDDVFAQISAELAAVSGGDCTRLLPAATTVPLHLEAPISVGELCDKISSLRIKRARIADAAKLRVVQRELACLEEIRARTVKNCAPVEQLEDELLRVNESLWDIEDRLRELEQQQSFGEEFIRLARTVYGTNDRRAELKRQINVALRSDLSEVKSYGPQKT